MSRPLTLLALVWAPFLSIFVFASQGDTSALHISSHVVALALLVPAMVMAWRMRPQAPARAARWILTLLSVTLPVAVLGHLGELVVAVQRLAADGWANRDTADIWEHGPHVAIANVTIPAVLLSMMLTAALVVVSLRLGRRSTSEERAVSRVG
jgi:heme/copper-type cytochrome/quinol oxidase subunit 2